MVLEKQSLLASSEPSTHMEHADTVQPISFHKPRCALPALLPAPKQLPPKAKYLKPEAQNVPDHESLK